MKKAMKSKNKALQNPDRTSILTYLKPKMLKQSVCPTARRLNNEMDGCFFSTIVR